MMAKKPRVGELSRARLRLVAGPNGSGKSTFTADILQKQVSLGVYVNPDEIALTLEGDELTRAKAAQQAAVLQREQLLLEAQSMTYESVMSHPSHLDFLKRAKIAGYRTYLYFVGVENPNINKERVKNREKLGGHGVPAEKIVPRYKRTMEQLFDACLLVNRAYVFDNSLNDYYMVAEVHEGELTLHHDNLAAQLSWHKTHLINKLTMAF
ncbi:MAG: zeta toxin family protein [Candidatus Parabeggiatoa sp.]|nr:zeta toxin family protein [Candidatus Parabeggiatoa sp.]